MKEKTADEMFEELGYEKIVESNIKILYEKEGNYWDKYISFTSDDKEVTAEMSSGDSETINMQELKAIYKKCEELRMDIEEAIKIMQHWIDYEKKNKDKINKADELIEIQETILKELENKNKEIDCLKNHVHYINCQKCGIEVRTKRSDRKYCKNCAKIVNNKEWYENLTEEQRMKRRDQSKLSMRKLRERRKLNDD